MENILKNKKVIIIVSVAIVALICLAVALSGSRDITGTWVVAQRSVDESFRKYPEDDFVIYENGSFTSDGVSGTYSMNDGTVTFDYSIFGSYTYEYDVSGNTLMLRNIDDEDNAKIYYDRVS